MELELELELERCLFDKVQEKHLEKFEKYYNDNNNYL